MYASKNSMKSKTLMWEARNLYEYYEDSDVKGYKDAIAEPIIENAMREFDSSPKCNLDDFFTQIDNLSNIYDKINACIFRYLLGVKIDVTGDEDTNKAIDNYIRFAASNGIKLSDEDIGIELFVEDYKPFFAKIQDKLRFVPHSEEDRRLMKEYEESYSFFPETMKNIPDLKYEDRKSIITSLIYHVYGKDRVEEDQEE